VPLGVARWLDPECCRRPRGDVPDRDEIYSTSLGAEDSEVVDLALIAAPCGLGIPMMAVAAADREYHSTIPKPPGLALDTRNAVVPLDEKIAARVFAERHVKGVSRFAEGEHDRQGGAIADVFRVVYVANLAYAADGAGTIQALRRSSSAGRATPL
jgi:hypothetical protein